MLAYLMASTGQWLGFNQAVPRRGVAIDHDVEFGKSEWAEARLGGAPHARIAVSDSVIEVNSNAQVSAHHGVVGLCHLTGPDFTQ